MGTISRDVKLCLIGVRYLSIYVSWLTFTSSEQRHIVIKVLCMSDCGWNFFALKIMGGFLLNFQSA